MISLKKYLVKLLFVASILIPSVSFSAPLFVPGETLDPGCLPSNPDCTVSTSTVALNYPSFIYASSTFPSFTYASTTYYLASNPDGFLTIINASSSFPTFSYASSTYALFSSSTQWTTNGSNIFYNAGNVGVGTTTPGGKLEIAGGHLVLSNGDFGTPAGIRYRNAGGSLDSGIYEANDNNLYIEYGDGNNLIYKNNSGISVFNFDNAGTMSVASGGGLRAFYGDYTDAIQIKTYGGVPFVNFDSLYQRVGIGTTTPSTALSVVGTSTTNGLTIINLASAFLATDSSGNVVSTTSPLTIISNNYPTFSYASGTFATINSLSGYLSTTSAATDYVSTTTVTSTYPTFSYASTTYYLASNPAGYLTTFTETDPIWMAASSSYLITVVAGNTYPTFTYSSSTFATQASLGSYVSTTTLAADYVSTSTAASTYVTYTYGSSTYYLASNPSGYISSYTETDPVWSAAAASYLTITSANTTYPSFTYASSTFATGTNWWTPVGSSIKNVNGGSVSIATTSADILIISNATSTYPLSIIANSLTSGRGINVANDCASGCGGDLMILEAKNTFNGDLANFSGGMMTGRGLYMNGGAGSAPQLRVETYWRTGNVAEIVGGGAMGNNGKGLYIGVGTSLVATGTVYGLDVAKSGVSSTSIGARFSATGGTEGNYAMIVPSNGGVVGIGTSTPVARLDIYGNASTTDIFAVSSSSNERYFTVTNAGNVGIGTSTPSSALTVIGNISTNGLIENSTLANNINLSATSSIPFLSDYPPAQNGTYATATTQYASTNVPYFATDPTKSLIGSNNYNSWNSASGSTTNQRFHIDLGSTKTIKRIYYENGHGFGGATNFGVKNFTLWGSNTAGDFADTVYANDGTWVQLTTATSSFDQHVALDQADPKYITVTNTTPYRYYAFKFADNWGNLGSMGVRRIELQEAIPDGITFSTNNLQRMTIYNGNVGIGTSTPGSVLTVNGSTTISTLTAGVVKSTSNGSLYTDSSTYLTANNIADIGIYNNNKNSLLYWSSWTNTPTVIKTVIVPGATDYGTWDGKNLWVGAYYNQTISKVDQDANILATYTLPGISPLQMSYDGRYIWVGSGDMYGNLVKFDPITGTTIATYVMNPSGLGGISNGGVQGVLWDGTNIWVGVAQIGGGAGSGFVAKLDPSTGNILASTTSQTNVNGIAVTDIGGTRYIWAANDGFISKIKASDMTYSTTSSGSATYRIATDGQYIYGSSFYDNSIYKFSTQDGSLVATWPSGSSLNTTVFDGKYIWTAGDDETVTIHDKDTGAIVYTIANGGRSDLIFDGTYMWSISRTDGSLRKITLGNLNANVKFNDNLSILSTGATTTLVYFSSTSTGSSYMMSKFGIGTTTPSSPLTVIGNISASTINGTYLSLGNGSVSTNLAVGSGTLATTTGGLNTAVGYQSLTANTTGQGNTANGYQTLQSNTTGIFNTANGGFALRFNTTGSKNTAIGYGALNNLNASSTGSEVALGYFAGYYATSTNNELFINNLDRSNYTGDITKSLVYGVFNSATSSQQLTINGTLNGYSANFLGNVGIGTSTPSANLTIQGTPTSTLLRLVNIGAGSLTSDADGNIINTSDENLKDIQGEYIKGLAAIKQLTPINYKWKSGTGLDASTTYSGFSAQNVESVIPEAIGKNGAGFLTLNDRPIIAALVNAIKEIGSFINKVENKIAYLTNIVIEKLTIGSDTNPTGITMYDRTTKQPYCVSVNNGALFNEPGECSIDTSLIENIASVFTPVIESPGTTTPEIIAEPATTTEPIIVEGEVITTTESTIVEEETATTTEPIIIEEEIATTTEPVIETPVEIIPEVIPETPIEIFLAPEEVATTTTP